MSKTAFILNGARTPFARMGTDFMRVSAVDLGRAAAVEAMARSGIEPSAIDQSIFGNIATPVDAANIARIIALRAGVPKERPAHSVWKSARRLRGSSGRCSGPNQRPIALRSSGGSWNPLRASSRRPAR